MFEAGWTLLEQIKIDTFPYCILKYGSRCVPAVPTARAAPLPPAIPNLDKDFSGVPEILGHITGAEGSPLQQDFFASAFRIAVWSADFPSAQGWLVTGVDSCWWESAHGFKPLYLGWPGALTLCVVLATRNPKHSCPCTQSCSMGHMELSKNAWKSRSTALCQNSESSHCQSSVLAAAVPSLVLAESPSHISHQNYCFHQKPSVPHWGAPSLPTQGRQFMD